MKRLSIGLVLALATAAGAGAQDAGPLRLTLDGAQARAVDASHRLAAERALGAAAAADVTAAELAGWPSVALEAAYTRTNHVTEFVVPSPAGGLRVLYPDVPNNYATRLGLRWPVYTGGRSEALVRAARATAGASAEEVRIAQADLRLDVARAFWARVSADAVAGVIARGVDRSLAHLSVAQERLANGLVAPNEVASAQARVSRQRMLLIEARNQRDLAGARLARLIGADVAQPVEAVATLAEAGAPALPLARLVDQALDARGERRAMEFRIDAADEQVLAASRSMRPTVVMLAASISRGRTPASSRAPSAGRSPGMRVST